MSRTSKMLSFCCAKHYSEVMNLQSIMNSISSQDLSNSCPSLNLVQSQSSLFTNVCPPNLANSGSLVFAGSDELLQQALKNNALGFIIPEKLLPQVQNVIDKNKSLWTTPNIHLAMTEVLKLFDAKTPLNAGIHSTAVIDSTAKIGKNVTIEPYAVIGKNVVIGGNSIVGAHTILENHSSIGENTQIGSHVFLGFNCHIGNNCKIGPQNVFGSDGFGFITDKQGQHHKIPQIGQVIIEDSCEFGTQCAVDRATMTETRIRKGSKFDNFIHIAHNCDIGENALIAAGFIIAGSSQVGKNLIAAGSVGVLGHLKVTDNVILTARTGVTSSIDKPGMYGGYPHTDHKENLKIMISQQSLPKLRKQVAKILKHLGLTEGES